MHKSRKKKHVVTWVREQLDLTQSDLAKLISASRDTIQSVEIGRLPLSERFAYAIANQTGFSARFLLANKIPKPCPSKNTSLEKYREKQRDPYLKDLGSYKAHLFPRMAFARLYAVYRAVFNEIGSGPLFSKDGHKLFVNFLENVTDLVPDKRRRKSVYSAGREIAKDSEKTLHLLLTDVQELQRVVRTTRRENLHDAA